MRLTACAAAFLAFHLALAACDTGGDCRSSSDCEKDEVCGYALGDGCNATGKCVGRVENCGYGAFPNYVCACDGTYAEILDCIDPGGYASAPIRGVNDQSCTYQDASPEPVDAFFAIDANGGQ